MSEGENENTFEKGDRAAVVGGRKGVGVRGEVFWIGENKYGPGLRYGLRGDDGETYWLDEKQIGPEETAPAAPEYEPKPVLEKGARVQIVKGGDAGMEGEVFWVGESKFGPGMRYGIRGDDSETYWADERQIEQLEAAPPKADGPDAEPPASRDAAPSNAAPPLDDAPFPDDDFNAPADDFDAPFPDDDVPF